MIQYPLAAASSKLCYRLPDVNRGTTVAVIAFPVRCCCFLSKQVPQYPNRYPRVTSMEIRQSPDCKERSELCSAINARDPRLELLA